MKRKLSGIFPVFFCFLFLLSACAKRTDVQEDSFYIYCLNSDRTGLIKVTYEVTETEPEKAAGQMLEELEMPAEDIDYTAPIPEGVKVNKYEMEGEILYIDFNEEYAKIQPLEENLVRASIVKSLVKIDGISGLWFTVAGKDMTDSTGKVMGYLNEDDFVQNTGSSLNSYETAELTLYFANKTGDKLVSQTIDAKYSSNTSKEKLIVEKLMQGPKKNTAYPTVNPDVTLLSVTIKDGICYVNLDDEFLNGGIDVKPEVTIYSIVNSLVEGTAANKVQITVNGEKNVSYMETIDLTQLFEEDRSWAKEAEGE